jgi:hypothetical protein
LAIVKIEGSTADGGKYVSRLGLGVPKDISGRPFKPSTVNPGIKLPPESGKVLKAEPEKESEFSPNEAKPDPADPIPDLTLLATTDTAPDGIVSILICPQFYYEASICA